MRQEMNNLIPTPDDIEQMLRDIQAFNNERNDALRKIFGKFIKQNFLIKIKEEIKKSDEFNSIMPQCYNLSIKPILALGTDDIDFDICSNLAMINWYLMLPLSDEELKSKLYKDENYIADLKKRTLNQCKLRQLIQNYEERNFLLAHLPINFSMHCVVNFLLDRINAYIKKKHKSNVPNANFKINTICVMLKTIRSILLLTEYDDCGNAFSLLRSLIETIFVYLAVYDNEMVANEYYKFMVFREIFEATGQYPEEFEQIAPLNCNKQNYLNYGWLDKLESKFHKYTFNEVVACSKKTGKDYNNAFLAAFKYCCKYVHGNYLNQGIPPYSFIWILARAGEILINISRQFTYIFSEETDYNGVNLEKYLTANVEEAVVIYSKMQNN